MHRSMMALHTRRKTGGFPSDLSLWLCYNSIMMNNNMLLITVRPPPHDSEPEEHSLWRVRRPPPNLHSKHCGES